MKIASALALLLLGGCSVIVQPGDDRVRCEVVEGVDPCPSGQRCAEGFCTPTECGIEVGCNGLDDDCDMTIDEGSDGDGDGFTWCNTESPELRDCRDDNSAIYPGAPDDPPCDGADNDCSGGPTLCPEGQMCDRIGQCREPDCTVLPLCGPNTRCERTADGFRCVVVDTTCPSTPCPSDQVCVEGTCLRTLGAGCDIDAQCESGLCVQVAALGIEQQDVGGAQQVCSSTCCEDTDCPAGSRCWAPGTGARGCIPEALLALGSAGVPSEEACSSGADCANECALRPAPGYRAPEREAYVCGDPVGWSTLYCDSSQDCESGLCIEYCGDVGCATGCSAGCGATSDCEDLDHCGWLELASGGFVQTCLWGRRTAGRAGEPCGAESDCRDGACVRGECADACCDDSHCPQTHRCRPVRNHGRFEMLCVPR